MVELYPPTAAPPPPFKFCQKFPRIGAQFLLNDSTSFLDILIRYSETKSDLSDFCPREQEKEERVSRQVILDKRFDFFNISSISGWSCDARRWRVRERGGEQSALNWRRQTDSFR